MAKRLFDIVFSLLGLTLCLPVFAVVAVIIKTSSKGPVFFIQRRVGKGFTFFNLYKFRTMVADAQNQGPLITTGCDSRITRVGRVLRKTKIDELPQLINVLKGDMSFVGPRPEVEKYVSAYRLDYEKILTVRPGITDIASLTYRDEELVLKDQENPEEYYIEVLLPEKIRLAKDYIETASLSNDVRLIFLTLFRIIYPRTSS